MITVTTSRSLLEHLSTHEVDGTTVADALFDGGRLCYPGRKDIEYQLQYTEPYVLAHEARVIDGLPRGCEASIRYLAGIATESHDGFDPTLDLLWAVHQAYKAPANEGPSLDRFVAALVTINDFREQVWPAEAPMVFKASALVFATFESIGLPINRTNLEELFEGADPACSGLGLVEL